MPELPYRAAILAVEVVLGVVVGFLLYRFIVTSTVVNHRLLWTTTTSSTPLLVLSLLLLGSGVLIYWILIFLNLDPAFSVKLAQEYCQHSSWVHLNTTPFFSLVRSSGTVLGMSLVSRMGMQTMRCGYLTRKIFGTRMNVLAYFGTITCLVALVLTGTGSVLLGRIDVRFSLLGDELLGFYAVSLFKAALVPLLTVAPAWLL